MAGTGDYPQEIRVAFCGPHGAGKTSLVQAMANEAPPRDDEALSSTLPPAYVGSERLPEPVPLMLVDTPGSDKAKAMKEAEAADIIALVYPSDGEKAMESLETEWLQLLQGKGARRKSVPVVVVGARADLLGQASASSAAAALMGKFTQVEACAWCSTRSMEQVAEVRGLLQKIVLHPVSVLYDKREGRLTSKAKRALARVFHLSDRDADGFLNDEELNAFQMHCFESPLQEDELSGIKDVVQHLTRDGVSERGISLEGFQALHELFVVKGRQETTWTVLRKFGYNNALHLRTDIIRTALPKCKNTESPELNDEVLEFLERQFDRCDLDSDGFLNDDDLEMLFWTSPRNPWLDDEWQGSTKLDKDGFKARWDAHARLRPLECVEYLAYFGWPIQDNPPLKKTRSRQSERALTRRVIKCAIFANSGVGAEDIMETISARSDKEQRGKKRLAARRVDIEAEGVHTLVAELQPLNPLGPGSDADELSTYDIITIACAEKGVQDAEQFLKEVAKAPRAPHVQAMSGSAKAEEELAALSASLELAYPLQLAELSSEAVLRHLAKAAVRQDSVPLRSQRSRAARSYRLAACVAGAASVGLLSFAALRALRRRSSG